MVVTTLIRWCFPGKLLNPVGDKNAVTACTCMFVTKLNTVGCLLDELFQRPFI
jgi:hypothetical protein